MICVLLSENDLFLEKIIISVTIVLVIFASIDLLPKIKMNDNDDVDVN
jgi:hypothetical protein